MSGSKPEHLFERRTSGSPDADMGRERYGTSARAPDHSGLIPADLITLVHFSIFSAMNLANSSGELGGTATAPRSANRCLMFGSSTAALGCLLSAAMISDG